MTITLLTFSPLLAAVLILILPKSKTKLIRFIAGLGFLLPLYFLLEILLVFQPGAGVQLVERVVWIPSLGVEYFVGVDGLNILLLVLAALVGLGVYAAGSPVKGEQEKIYFLLLLLQMVGLYGVFTALNFYHWFLFWEWSLVPAFFLIKLFGHERRHSAALRFVVFTVVGSLAMLIGFLYLYLQTGTFDFLVLAQMARAEDFREQIGDPYLWIFAAIFLGLAVKIPIYPFHLWLPETYEQAPTVVSMVLTGLMSKMGVYAFCRLLVPIFPQAIVECQTILLILVLLTIVMSTWSALRQIDWKRMVAYSSVNHMGLAVLGSISAVLGTQNYSWENAMVAAWQGSVLQMFNHGVTAAALFYLLGLLEMRSGSRFMVDFGGLRAVLPQWSGFLVIVIFSSIGLPFLNGFISEFLIFRGVWAIAPWAAVVSLLGLLATALFYLNFMQKVLQGPFHSARSVGSDLTWREKGIATLFLIFIVGVGVFPAPLLQLTQGTAQQFLYSLR